MTYPQYDLLKRWTEKQKPRQEELSEMPGTILIGGLDLAERVDSTALCGLLWTGKNLLYHGTAVWSKIQYPDIIEDLERMQELYRFDEIGFDGTGVGAGVAEFISAELPMQEMVLSNKTKVDAINVTKLLLQKKILRVEKNSRIVTEILEQEKIKLDSGRISYKHPVGRHDDLFWAMAIACYVSVPYVVGMAPAAIEATHDSGYDDVEETIEDDMRKHSAGWGNW